MAFVHGPMLKKTGVKTKELLHSTDWYPTLINLAGKKKGGRGPRRWLLSISLFLRKQVSKERMQSSASLHGLISYTYQL